MRAIGDVNSASILIIGIPATAIIFLFIEILIWVKFGWFSSAIIFLTSLQFLFGVFLYEEYERRIPMELETKQHQEKIVEMGSMNGTGSFRALKIILLWSGLLCSSAVMAVVISYYISQF